MRKVHVRIRTADGDVLWEGDRKMTPLERGEHPTDYELYRVRAKIMYNARLEEESDQFWKELRECDR